ncbi:hypothetical protein J5N97_005529 [Dioscorea zingiberensis]|uniref:EF-hand domain-containing protein n=1 Tax=Dioscorea zingiberensis TaxID=325984 RepID=A0A9D5DAF4_9LILI|nr:hypothetical protein J5N97_005529 [Dioscorea zingiberensis]
MAPPPLTNTTTAATDILGHVFSMIEAFKAFDSDNDGLITVEELGGILSSLGYNPSSREIATMMRQGDTDGDGLLSLEEFLEINTRELNAGSLAGLLQPALQELSLQGDDAITREELSDALRGLMSMEERMDIIASLDGDGDGILAPLMEKVHVIFYETPNAMFPITIPSLAPAWGQLGTEYGSNEMPKRGINLADESISHVSYPPFQLQAHQYISDPKFTLET